MAVGIMVAQDLQAPRYRYRDPDALLLCDNPACEAPWVTKSGLVAWRVGDAGPIPGLFADRFVVGCNAHCLQRAKAAQHMRRNWSGALPVGRWLELLRASLDVDPETTPIGQLAPLGLQAEGGVA